MSRQVRNQKSKAAREIVVEHLLKTTVESDLQDSMVINYAVKTTEVGVRETKVYLNTANPEECKMKIQNAVMLKDYANDLLIRRISHDTKNQLNQANES
jgi:hypothetical protein